MKILITLLTLLIFNSCSSTKLVTSRPESNYSFSIIQGTTTEDSTIIRVIYPRKLKVNYIVTDDQNKNIPVKKVKSFKKSYSEFKVEHIKVTGLDVNNTYTLKINSDNKRWSDERTFKSLNTQKEDLKILIASCMSDAFNEIGNVIWPKAFSHEPDVTFLIGDNLYADTYAGIYLGKDYPANPKHLWNRYVGHAMVMKIYRMKHLTPTYVTWDDHDYGQNDGGKDYRYKSQSKRILNIFFPREKSLNHIFGPGVSTKLQLGGMNFLFLDGRSYRSTKKNKSGSHFGKRQKKWIHKNLDPKKFNWLISGDQFFGGYHQWESFEGNHPETFKKFIQGLRDSRSKVSFISGDRHLIEVMKIPKSQLGYKTYEYTVSGIHTKMYPGSLERDPNPNRVGGFDGLPNYAILTTKYLYDEVNVKFEAYSIKGLELSSEHEISLKL